MSRERQASNGLYFDGVDSRSPSDGTAWVFVNFNIVAEVQVQGLGANAEYGSFTLAVVNTITRSGGNAVSGLFDVQYTKDAFASDNLSDELLAENPELGESAKTTKYLDFTAQVGGPILQDRLFYFFRAQRLENRTDPSGPIERSTTSRPSRRESASVSGFPFQVEQTLSRSATNLPFALVSSTARTIYLEPRGSRRTEMQHRLDVRFEKIFNLGGGKDRLAVYADVFNLLNADYETDYYNNVADEYFLAPPSIVAPRQWTFGARWSF